MWKSFVNYQKWLKLKLNSLHRVHPPVWVITDPASGGVKCWNYNLIILVKCSRSAQVKKLNSDFTSCLSESVECFSHCPRPKREDDCFFCYSDVWKCQMQCHREAENSENPEKFCMARCNASALNCLDKC